jgi:FSR family fosmidomycin resistance protein-like MFS transporter
VTIALSVVTYLPILQKMRGFSLLTAGSSITLFMVFAGLGGLSGGYLADRFGRRTIIVSSFIFIIPVYVAFLYWQGSLSFLSLALMGFLLFLTEPPCIVMAQEMIPRNARTASGLIMGMSWGVAGFGVLGVGILADLFGVRQALTYILALPAVAIFFSCFLPRN